MTISAPLTKDQLAAMGDDELAAYAEQHGQLVHDSTAAYTAAIEVQLTRVLRDLYPDGRIVRFDTTEYENGYFLGIDEVLDADNMDIRDTFDDGDRERSHPKLEVLLGEITHCWGAGNADADEALNLTTGERVQS